MKNIVLLIICFVFAQGYEFEREYYYTESIIHSGDLFPEIPQNFEILKIPEDKIMYRIDSRVIAKSFELHGITIDTSKTPFINFVKKSPVDFSPLQQQLSDMLQGRYDTIDIQNIVITPRGYLASLPIKAKAVFDSRCHLNSSGTFFIVDDAGLRRYLDYTVTASIGVLHLTRKVARKEEINRMNASLRTIPFRSFKDVPLTHFPDRPYRFRSNLKTDHLLTVRNIEEVPLVLKNEKVIVAIQNGAVVVEFGAIAIQEGSLYDIITIQKRDGKRAKAKVIGENRVELQ